MSENENKFTQKLFEEINSFHRKQSLKSVLVFPPLLKRYRYLFHELIQQYFGHIFGTISIGKEGDRRPLLYYKSFINSIQMSQEFDEEFVHELPQLPSDENEFMSLDEKELNKSMTSVRHRDRRPDMKLYVPPKAKSVNTIVSQTDLISVEDKTCVQTYEPIVQTLSQLEINDSTETSHHIFGSQHISSDCTPQTSPPHNCFSSKYDSMTAEEQNQQNSDIKTSKHEIKGDENSWDSLFDENGDCVRPEFVEKVNCELSVRNSQIKLEKTRIDYMNFQYNEPEIDSSEFAHVLEVYNFPIELKTQDLMASLSVFNCVREFDIKWVDDTHALVVFSNSNAATEALKAIYPNIQLRPLSQGIRESKLKARKCSEFLRPYKQRPQTSASLARRLVTGALGLRVRLTPEERAAEKKKLQEAKERKRQAIKQVQDVWEGNV